MPDKGIKKTVPPTGALFLDNIVNKMQRKIFRKTEIVKLFSHINMQKMKKWYVFKQKNAPFQVAKTGKICYNETARKQYNKM